MRVLIVSAVFPPEPVVSATISIELARRLSEDGCDVVVLSPTPTRPNGITHEIPTFSNEKFRHIIVDSYTHPASDFLGRMKESYSFGRATAQYVRDHKSEIDVVYANTWPIFGQSLLVREADKCGIPIALHIQDIYPESMLGRMGFLGRIVKYPLRWYDRRICRRSTIIFAISERMKELLQQSRGIPSDRIIVVRNWQDNSLFTCKTDLRNDKFTFMFVGSISPAAGVKFLIESFIVADISNSRLVIAGDGSDRLECEQYAQRYKQYDISFCSVSPSTVPQVQSQADVLLLPLRKGVGYTASPSKMPAYMFSSKPILASVDPDSDVDMIIKSSQCGWVCTPEDVNEMSSTMREVANLPLSVLRNKGESANDYAKRHFTADRNLSIMSSNILSINGVKANTRS